MIKYNGFTVDEMLGFIQRQGFAITIETMTEYEGLPDWRVILYSDDRRQVFSGGTLFRATMEAFKQFYAAAKQERKEAQDKFKAMMGLVLNCPAELNQNADDQAFVDEHVKEALSMIESIKHRAAVEMKLAELRALLDGANERSRSLLDAKNRWLNRAKNAHTQIDELRAERNAMAAHQAELVRELAACQGVLHSLAHCGQVTPAYADDAKAVLDRRRSA